MIYFYKGFFWSNFSSTDTVQQTENLSPTKNFTLINFSWVIAFLVVPWKRRKQISTNSYSLKWCLYFYIIWPEFGKNWFHQGSNLLNIYWTFFDTGDENLNWLRNFSAKNVISLGWKFKIFFRLFLVETTISLISTDR